MAIKKLVSIFFVFGLFLGGQVFLAKEGGYAQVYECCGCGSQSWCAGDDTCHCPGAVPWCIHCGVAPELDDETLKFTPPAQGGNGAVYMRGIPNPALSSATEDMISDIRGSNGRKDRMGKLAKIDKIKFDLKYSCHQAKEDYWQGTRLGLQVKAEIKK